MCKRGPSHFGVIVLGRALKFGLAELEGALAQEVNAWMWRWLGRNGGKVESEFGVDGKFGMIDLSPCLPTLPYVWVVLHACMRCQGAQDSTRFCSSSCRVGE